MEVLDRVFPSTVCVGDSGTIETRPFVPDHYWLMYWEAKDSSPCARTLVAAGGWLDAAATQEEYR